ncbi:transglutaminase-like domain-containing protein [Feifania hominis]|uniref:Transglutaminase domain-containing protein n=1 Tax=Feifania hominis TaxID=2763660 RepID=A0A926HUA6_9FIRM|nr:transglutaminase-like domain-containing protein [Feifania hominis]MBC8535341.1 transglutaminase domain-containing protein [Feifania hominis]
MSTGKTTHRLWCILGRLNEALVLLLALSGLLFGLATAYGIQTDTVVLAVCCLGFTAYSYAVLSLPRYRWAALLLTALGYVLALKHYWQALLESDLYLYGAVVNTLADGLGLFDPIELPAGYIAEQGTRAGTLWLGLLAVGFALLLGWTILCRRSTLLTALAALPPLIPALLAESFPAWGAVMALTASLLVLALGSLVRHSSAADRSRFTAVSLPTVALLLFFLTAALPEDSYRFPRWAAQAQNTLINLGSKLTRTVLTAGSDERVPLSGGPLRYTGRTLLHVTADQPGSLYLRGYSSAVYTGVSWEPLDESAYQHLTSLSGLENPFYFPALVNLQKDFHTITVENLGAPNGCVYIPYQLAPVSGGVENAGFVGDTHLAPLAGSHIHTMVYSCAPLREDTFDPLTGVAADAEAAYREFVYRNYLTLPEGFYEGIRPWRELAQTLPPPDTGDLSELPALYREPIRQALTVAALLDMTTEYDAQTPAAPGEDFVLHFLTASRRGYCMHYASAATLLLRAQGIPARYVGGFAALLPEAGGFDIPDSAAHAWVEIYLDGYGWYPVEVTPGGGEMAEPPITPAEPNDVPTTDDPQPEPPVPDEPDEPESLDTPEPEEEAPRPGGSGADAIRIAVGATLLMLCLLAARRALLCRRRRRRLNDPNPNRAAIHAYSCLQRLLPWGAHCDEQMESLARKAMFSQHTLTADERTAMLEYLNRETARLDRELPRLKRLWIRYLLVLY